MDLSSDCDQQRHACCILRYSECLWFKELELFKVADVVKRLVRENVTRAWQQLEVIIIIIN